MPDPLSLPTIPWQALNVTQKMERVQNSLESEKLSPIGEGDPQVKAACSELESLFIYHLLKEMRATIPKNGFISGGNAEEIYTSILDLQLAREISLKGGIGISPFLFDQLGSKPEYNQSPNGGKGETVKNTSGHE
jgi:flagellar protein FlgJ